MRDGRESRREGGSGIGFRERSPGRFPTIGALKKYLCYVLFDMFISVCVCCMISLCCVYV